jgi:hypothetical protein
MEKDTLSVRILKEVLAVFLRERGAAFILMLLSELCIDNAKIITPHHDEEGRKWASDSVLLEDTARKLWH